MSIYQKIFLQHGLSPTQQRIIDSVGSGKRVLEIGAATGYMTYEFKKNGCKVDVVEIDKKAAASLKKIADKVIFQSIEDTKVFDSLSSDYEFIVLADVLEHLVDTGRVLQKLKEIAGVNTKLLVSLPNIACWPMRKQLFFKGDFEYQESGLLDKTHLHFYTHNSFPKMLSQFGWEVLGIEGIVVILPFENKIKSIPFLGKSLVNAIKSFLKKNFPNLAIYHMLAVAKKQ